MLSRKLVNFSIVNGRADLSYLLKVRLESPNRLANSEAVIPFFSVFYEFYSINDRK